MIDTGINLDCCITARTLFSFNYFLQVTCKVHKPATQWPLNTYGRCHLHTGEYNSVGVENLRIFDKWAQRDEICNLSLNKTFKQPVREQLSSQTFRYKVIPLSSVYFINAMVLQSSLIRLLEPHLSSVSLAK